MTRYYRVRLPGGPVWASEAGARLRLLDGAPYAEGSETGHDIPFSDANLLAPVMPSKIIAVGFNYRDHAAELGIEIPTEPLLFFKPPSAIIGPHEAIRIPPGVGQVDFEAELAIVIGCRVKNATLPEAAAAIFGCVPANDVTARELQRKDAQFTRPKGFDTFFPVGPALVKGLSTADLAIACRVNAVVRQSSRTSQLIFSVPELVQYISRVMTLLPGDIISTGTPAGIGPLKPRDTVEVEVEGCGTLSNVVTEDVTVPAEV